MATAEPVAEPIPERSDVAKAKRHVFNRHLAHEGIMLDRMQRQLRNAESLQRFAATNDTNDLPKPGDDDMGVNIGNEYHLHQVMQPNEPKPSTPVGPAIGTSIGSKLWPLVLGASLACGSTGLGWLLAKWDTPPPPAAADTDTDTITELDFPK